MKFLHELPDVKELFSVIASERKVLPAIVEKDYWIMHTLWGLQQQGFRYELKGGTSLSKGFGIIQRFSEDIDLQIHPELHEDVKVGKNHDKDSHVDKRRNFFDELKSKLSIGGLTFTRDENFDDKKMRSAGIRGNYNSFFPSINALKDGVLLEIGFDNTTPNLEKNISSWAFDKVKELKIDVINNQALNVKCYCPEYTFVEKLQAISTKHRQHQEKGKMPPNFLRHYYDVYQLLDNERVRDFIGSPEYHKYKEDRFPSTDEKNLSQNDAFSLKDNNIRKLYEQEYSNKKDLYFEHQPSLQDIIGRIQIYIDKL